MPEIVTRCPAWWSVEIELTCGAGPDVEVVGLFVGVGDDDGHCVGVADADDDVEPLGDGDSDVGSDDDGDGEPVLELLDVGVEVELLVLVAVEVAVEVDDGEVDDEEDDEVGSEEMIDESTLLGLDEALELVEPVGDPVLVLVELLGDPLALVLVELLGDPLVLVELLGDPLVDVDELGLGDVVGHEADVAAGVPTFETAATAASPPPPSVSGTMSAAMVLVRGSTGMRSSGARAKSLQNGQTRPYIPTGWPSPPGNGSCRSNHAENPLRAPLRAPLPPSAGAPGGPARSRRRRPRRPTSR